MKLLKELQKLAEGEKKFSVSRDIASKVYHRDYVKTKNKKYRKYDPAEDKK